MDQQSGGQLPPAALSRSQVQRWRIPDLEKVHHHQLGQEWIPHWHTEWSIGAIVRGRCLCSIDGRSVNGLTGDLIAIAPQTVHTGALASLDPFDPVSVVMLYVSPQWFAQAEVPPPSSSGFIQAPDIALMARDLQAPSDVERWLLQAVGALTDTLQGMPKDAIPSAAVIRVLTAFEQSYCEGASSVTELARRCNVSREQLHRVIRRWTGMSPTHYLRALRINKAREMLLAGEKPATVAAACGFSDQAHLIRLFRRSFGYTPGDLIAALASN